MGGPIDIAQRGWQLVVQDHDHDHLVTKVRCMDLPDSDRGDFSCRRGVDSSSSFFTCIAKIMKCHIYNFLNTNNDARVTQDISTI